MSAGGTISLVASASCGDNLTACWTVWFRLDDPHAIADTGEQKDAHEWAVNVPRKEGEFEESSLDWGAGDRIEVSTHGKHNVLITRAGQIPIVLRSYTPGVFDPTMKYD